MKRTKGLPRQEVFTRSGNGSVIDPGVSAPKQGRAAKPLVAKPIAKGAAG